MPDRPDTNYGEIVTGLSGWGPIGSLSPVRHPESSLRAPSRAAIHWNWCSVARRVNLREIVEHVQPTLWHLARAR